MVRTQIQLTEAQAEALKGLAAQQGTSMADLVRTAVDGILVGKGLVSAAARKERLLATLGRFRSDRTDVAEQHDAYLDEALSP